LSSDIEGHFGTTEKSKEAAMRSWYLASFAALIAMLIRSDVDGSTESIGMNGINSAGLGLTGAGIGIGQVEVNRPGKRIADVGKKKGTFYFY
jgi:hypothetical protein